MANRRPTMIDLAREAGVSTTLASFALNGKSGVAPETRRRILEVAERIGYRLDPFARALRTGVSQSYAIMVRNMRNPYFLDVLEGAQEAASEQDVTMVAINSNFSVTVELEHIDRIVAQRMGGLAITPVGPGAAVDRWRELCPDLPLVVVDALEGFGEGVRYVSPDDEAAVNLAVDHLAQLGHRRVTLLTPPSELSMDHERLRAFMRRCASLGVTPEYMHSPLSYEAVRSATQEALSRPDPPRAIITNSDYTAHAVYRAARDYGVRIGAELSVVGRDDLPTSDLLDPPLTTLRFDRRNIGRVIFERLHGGDDSRHIEPVELIVRSSTAPPCGP